MSEIENDGYYVPKDPILHKQWADNAKFDADAYWASRQSTIMSTEELTEYNKSKDLLAVLSRLVRAPINDLPERILDLKNSLIELQKEKEHLENV